MTDQLLCHFEEVDTTEKSNVLVSATYQVLAPLEMTESLLNLITKD